MWILGIYTRHDAGVALFKDYDMVAAVALERLTRNKSDGNRFPDEAIDDCLAIAGISRADVDVVALPRVEFPARYFHSGLARLLGSRNGEVHLLRTMNLLRTGSPDRLFDARRYLADQGFRPDVEPFFYNHHQAHALAALFHTDWTDALLYTADAVGDRVHYSARVLREKRLEDLFGGESESRAMFSRQRRALSLGQLYAATTHALGFKAMRHEGKVLGLAAFGVPRYAEQFRAYFHVAADGRILSHRSRKQNRKDLADLVATARREDLAASVQHVLEDVITLAIERILSRHPARNLGLAGGVFANVKLTQRLAERFACDEVFVYPAMSDQGEGAGGCLQYLLERDGLETWLGRRWRFPTLYYGRDHSARSEAAFRDSGAHAVHAGDIVEPTARLIADGRIVGTYFGRMEYGPRALGARSILAHATDRAINNWLNQRLDRTEFMPFAPVIRAERVRDVFSLAPNLDYAARFMTVTCDVRPEWRERIPAVVHVDGTARPQVVSRSENALYYDILAVYERMTGLPVLINTSFNAHEEPIVNRPEEAVAALRDGRIDYVVTENAIWSMKPASADHPR